MTDFVEELRTRREQGESALQITQAWSQRIINNLDDCIAATGSTGRNEALPNSDLDTIRTGLGDTPRLLDLIESGVVHSDSLGATAHSLALPQTEDEWITAASGWASNPAADKGVVKLGLLADASSPVHAEAFRVVPGTPLVAEMLRDALFVSTPRISGWFSAATLHLKDELLTPLVKLARWGALATGQPAHSTPERFRVSDGEFLTARTLIEAYTIGMDLRLDIEFKLLPHGVFDRRGRVVLSALPKERLAELKGAVDTLRKTQAELKYHLSTSAFAVRDGGHA